MSTGQIYDALGTLLFREEHLNARVHSAKAHWHAVKVPGKVPPGKRGPEPAYSRRLWVKHWQWAGILVPDVGSPVGTRSLTLKSSPLVCIEECRSVMPRNDSSKRGSSKPWRGRGAQRTGRRNRDLLQEGRPDNDTGFRGFSMADEARHTSQHSSHWETTGSLRSKPVSFVSAGPIDPLKELDENHDQTEDDTHRMEHDLVPVFPPSQVQSQPVLPEDTDDEAPPTTLNRQLGDNVDDESIIGPEELEQVISRASQPKGEREPSFGDTETNFFFDLKGDRQREAPPRPPVSILSGSPRPESVSSDEVILFKGRDPAPMRTAFDPVPTTTISLNQMQAEIHAVEQDLSIPNDTDRRKGRPRGNKATPKRPSQRRSRRQRDEIEDDDTAAIAADYLNNMRENGEMTDFFLSGAPDPRNLRDLGGSHHEEPSHDRPSFPAILDPGACKQQEVQYGSFGSGSESGSDLDDATLAKLLQGHVPGTEHEIVSEGLASSSGDSSDDDQPAVVQTLQHDAHTDDFDLMDWNRPSLRGKKAHKAARAQSILNISDAELRETLQKAWNNDRFKKSERKRQREELRAQGMLGKHAGTTDLRTKYPAGMDIESVGEEIRDFLRGTAQTVTMPPMDTHARKIIHEIANKFQIKSKSTGKADQRRTSLYRTKRTLNYSEKSFDQAIARIHRRFLPRLDVKGKRGNKAPLQRNNHAAASYREGEVVGAAAPELGSDNRGRAMLEKMGWSTGTALGAMDNKGILQPVPQTMKKSKAGLG